MSQRWQGLWLDFCVSLGSPHETDAASVPAGQTGSVPRFPRGAGTAIPRSLHVTRSQYSEAVWGDERPPEERNPDIDKELSRAINDLHEGHEERAWLRVKWAETVLRPDPETPS